MAHTFARLLLATEHSEFDTGAEALAFALARRCALPLAGVLPVPGNAEFDMVAPQQAARLDADAAERRRQLEAGAQAAGVALTLQVRRGPELWQEIVAEARERASDLLVIRRRGKRGLLANLLVGEMVSKVVAHAPCSVLIAPPGAAMWSRRVIAGVDPQSPDAGLVAVAAALAAECALPLHLLCVASGAAERADAERTLAQALPQARAAGAAVDGAVRVGRPHQALLDATQAGAGDLLVVARHGADTLGRAWIGGVAQKVIGLAECPVLVHIGAVAAAPAAPTAPHPRGDTT